MAMLSDYDQDIQFDLILTNLKVTNRKQLLMQLARHASEHLDISEQRLYKKILHHEKTANTYLGDDIALPNFQGKNIPKSFTVLATLDKPIDFCGDDFSPVDLIGLVLSPADDGPLHLRRLARISRLLKNDILHKRLSEAIDAEAVRSLLIDPQGWTLAA